jgi:hypothetical protein
MEVWLARLDRQLAEAQAPPVLAKPRADRWQLALFGTLVASLVLAVCISIFTW